MSRADELLAKLRELVAESRDPDIPDFYHAIDNGAHLAGAFDELDRLMRRGEPPPQDWCTRG